MGVFVNAFLGTVVVGWDVHSFLLCVFFSRRFGLVRVLPPGTICCLRNALGVDHALHSILRGLLAGVSLWLEYPSRHLELLLFCIPRALEAVLNLVGNVSPAVRALLPALHVLCFSVRRTCIAPPICALVLVCRV